MPPRIATANALMPNSVPMSECTLNSGAISSPARPASAVESANESGDRAPHVDAHQARRIGVLHHREQRLAEARAVKRKLQRDRDAEPDHRDDELQRIDAGAEELDRLLRQDDGKPRGSLPKVNSTTLSSTMPPATVAISQAFEPRSANGRTSVRSTSRPNSAHSSERQRDGKRQRPAERDGEGVAEHGAEHHRGALREIDGVGDDVGDVKAERDQPVHAAEPKAGDDRGDDQHGVPGTVESRQRDAADARVPLSLAAQSSSSAEGSRLP